MCATATKTGRVKNKVCGCCDEPFVITPDDPTTYSKRDKCFVCEDCEQNYYQYCGICGDWCHEDRLCGHVFWDDEGGWWTGPGKFYEDKDIERLKPSFLALLDYVDHHGVVPMYHALKHGRHRMRLWGSMLGPINLEVEFGDYFSVDFIDNIPYYGTKVSVERLISAGANLLYSLDRKTKDENKVVRRWIREWLTERGQQRFLRTDKKRRKKRAA